MNRFLRDYQLVITTDSQEIEILPPINIEFDCEKSLESSGNNRLSLKIYNLNETKRESLQKDKDAKKYIQVKLLFGYENNLKLVFQGNVETASVERSGANLMLILECFDGLADTKHSYTSGTATSKREAVDKILKTMPNTKIGKITEQNKIFRPKVLMGNAYEELKKLTKLDEEMFIDDEKLYIIKKDEVTDDYAVVIDAETGLIDIPKKQEEFVECSTVLNPAIKLGGVVKLDSLYAPHLNGEYKVQTISFSGGYESQSCTQDLKLKLRESNGK